MRKFLFCLPWIAACGLLGPNIDEIRKRRLDPVPDVYLGWYEAVESCVGRTGDFDAISWYVADDLRRNGEPRAGVLRFPHAITLRADFVEHPGVVMHEMVHHVMRRGDELHGTILMDACS